MTEPLPIGATFQACELAARALADFARRRAERVIALAPLPADRSITADPEIVQAAASALLGAPQGVIAPPEHITDHQRVRALLAFVGRIGVMVTRRRINPHENAEVAL